MFDAPEPGRGFSPVVPALIGLAAACVWFSLFPAMATLCALASDLMDWIAS